MRVLLTVCLVVFMVAMPPLVPRWTPSSALVMGILGLLCTAIIVAMWWWRRAEIALRVAAGLVAVIFVLAAADQLRAAIMSGSPIVGGRTPVVGLFIVGLPCAVFAVVGLPASARASLGPLSGDIVDEDDEFDDLDEDRETGDR